MPCSPRMSSQSSPGSRRQLLYRHGFLPRLRALRWCLPTGHRGGKSVLTRITTALVFKNKKSQSHKPGNVHRYAPLTRGHAKIWIQAGFLAPGHCLTTPSPKKSGFIAARLPVTVAGPLGFSTRFPFTSVRSTCFHFVNFDNTLTYLLSKKQLLAENSCIDL